MVPFLPHVSKVYRLEDIDSVQYLATRDYGGSVVYQSVSKGVLGGILGGFVFYLLSVECIVWKIYRQFQIWSPGTVAAL